MSETGASFSRKDLLAMLRGGEIEIAEAEKLLDALGRPDEEVEVSAENRYPARCPTCGEELRVVRLRCRSCSTVIEGTFQPCSFCTLEKVDRDLLRLFLRCRGNLKEVGRGLGLSYPTVRARVENLLLKLGLLRKEELAPLSILRALREGRLTVEEAIRQLRRGK